MSDELKPVKYSHYGVTQKQLRKMIADELNHYRFDNAGQLLNQSTIKVEVTLEHPLLVLVNMVLFPSSGSTVPDLNAMFPRVAVTDASHREQFTTLGQGIKSYSILKSSDVLAFKNSVGSMKNRVEAGMLITDEQINNMLAITESLGGEAVLMKQEIMQDVTYYISVWALTVDHRIILTQIVEATLYGLKPEFAKIGLKNTNINTDTSIVNSNFARMIFGTEIELTGINTISNYTLLTEKPSSQYGLETFPHFKKFGDENFDPYSVWEKEE